MKYIRNISGIQVCIHKYSELKQINEQKQRIQTQWGGRRRRPPIGGAAEGGASVFFVSAHLSFYIMNIYGYSLYIPYIFHIYMS